MADTVENGQRLVKNAAAGKVDYYTAVHMDSSVAIFGDLYNKNKERINALPADKQFGEIEKLAYKSAELSPAAPYSNATSLVKHDIGVLIADSKKMDKPGEAEGTHLKKWAETVAGEVKNVDFTKIYHADGTALNQMEALGAKTYIESLGKKPGEKTFSQMKEAIRKSAEENISPDFKTQSLQQNLVANVRAEAKAHEKNPNAKGAFDEVTADDPKPRGAGAGMGIMQLIMAFIGMLLGIDLGGLLGGQQPSQETQQQLSNNGIAPVLSADLEKKLDALIPAAQHLRDGNAKPEDIKAVAGFSGVVEADLNALKPEAKEKLGKEILEGVTDLHYGTKKVEDINTGIQKFSQDKANQASIDSPQKDGKDQANAMAAVNSFVVGATSLDWEKIVGFAKTGMTQLAADASLAPGAEKLGKLAPDAAVAAVPEQQKGQGI